MPVVRSIGALLALGSFALSSVQAAVPTPPWLVDPFPSTYVPPPAPPLFIRHAVILTGGGDRLDDADLVVADGHVVAVGRGLAPPPGAQEVDARGRWVTPGIIDIHSHDGTFAQPQTSIDREASDVSDLSDPNVADTLIETAINPQDPAFSRALASGVTTLQVLPGSSPIFSGRSAILKPIPATTVPAMKFPGAPPGFKMACGENPKEQDASSHRGPTSRQGEVAYIRRSLFDARDYLQDWKAFAAGGKAAPKRDLKREALAGILNGDVRLHIHCYRADDMATYLAISREFGFRITAFHHATEAYKIPDLLRENDTCAAVWGDWWGFKMEAQDAIRGNAPLLDRAGVCVSMHSDSAASGQRLATEAAKAAAAARPLGIIVPPEQMIRWVTSYPARMLGLQDRIGTIAPGRNADVVLWSGNPFSIYTKADLVIIDGAVAYDRAHPPLRPSSDFELGREAVKPR
jgi:imidazolonepropionase-like amidohydrolase